jgi:two-component system, cell cycle sensor histidine kinase PleC
MLGFPNRAGVGPRDTQSFEATSEARTQLLRQLIYCLAIAGAAIAALMSMTVRPAIMLPVSIVLALAPVAAAASAFVGVRRASRPLGTLLSDVNRIADGDYSLAPPLQQDDEVGRMSRALARLAHAVAERETLLSSAVDSLEIARQEAVAASQAKSRLLVEVSRDLRDDLNTILGFAQMLQQDSLSAKARREYAHDICAGGEQLVALASRLANFPESDDGRFGIVRNPIDAEEILVRAVEGVRAGAEKANIRLTLDITCEVWTVLGDRAKLGQALTNILENAVKFTPAKGAVSVSTSARGKAFVVRVEDTGAGMRQEDIARVTERFQRLRNPFEVQGAGLGLPFAKAVAALHGGALSITSSPGYGTAVELVLPLAASERGRAA